MRISLLSIPLLLLVFAAPTHPQPQAQMPMIISLDPTSGAVGDVLTARGQNLGRERVDAVYLTDGKTDIKVLIVEQTATSIQFRIPPEAKAGRLAVMVLTTGKEPKLIEEPVKITIEPDATQPPT